MISDRNSTGNRSASLVWLVSFGDLLTLLLTFFISAIAQHQSDKQGVAGDVKATIQNHDYFLETAGVQDQQLPPGTMIAAVQERERAGTFALYLDDIDLQSPQVGKVGIFLESEISQSSGITLEVCSPYQDDSLNGVRLRVQRTLQIVAQESPQALGMVKVLPAVVHQCEKLRSEESPLAVARLVSFRNGRGRGRREKGSWE
jgi:flagellar motor protein MotB